jgi:Domain of unknown function (DUF4440)
MKHMILILVGLALSSSTVLAQNKAETENVKEAVRQWASAGDRQDPDAAAAFMAEEFRMVGNRLFGSPDVSTTDKALYLQLLRDKKIGGLPRTVKFKAVTVLGANAAVTVQLQSSALRFDSLLQLIQGADGKWRLVADLPQVVAL